MKIIFKKPMITTRVSLFILLAAFCLSFFSVKRVEAASITDGAMRYKLNNGFHIILKEDHSAPVVSTQVWVKTGSANESEKEAGITHVIEHMIFKGTHRRKTGEIARSVESSGGNINAYTTFDRTVYFIEIESSHFDTALDVLLDALQNSLFDPAELEREKEVILEEYRRSLDLPNRQLSWAMHDLSYKVHPYRRPIIGYEATIRSFDRDDILKYMDKWYTPDNVVLVSVGDFDRDEALKKIRMLVKNLPDRPGESPWRPVEPEQLSPRSKVIRSNVQQAYMDMSWHIPSMTNPHIPSLNLLEVILGHGNSSRLYTRLKMEKNLVRSIGAYSFAMVDPGLFSIKCTLMPENIKSALAAIMDEIQRISMEPVLEQELSKAKRIAESGYLSTMESMEGQAHTLAFFETMTGDMFKANEYLEKLRRVTARDIQEVAGFYLRPNSLSTGILMPEGSDIDLSEDQITEILVQRPDNDSANSRIVAEKDTQAIAKYTLSNGIRVLIKENHRLPLVSIRAALLGGTRFEDANHSGISSFVAKMLTRGTKTMTAAEIASTVESWGADLDGFSGRNSFGVSAKFLSGNLYSGLSLIAELINHPSFPESEMERVRADMLTDIKSKKDNPIHELSDLFNSTLYQNHPYGRPTTGTDKSIRFIKREDLITWYKSLVVPSNLVLTVVGDVDKGKFLKKINILFGDLVPSTFQPPEILSEPPLKSPREVHLERPGNQVHIMIGYLGTDLKSPDNAAMTLIDTALSGQGGRLFLELRDRRSLAYSVSSFRRPGLETGLFGVYLACEPEKFQDAKDALFLELERLKKEGLSEQELEDAKKYLLGQMAIEYQTNGSQALRMALDELYGLGYDHHRRFMREIVEVTADDVRSAAERIILQNGYTMATVGPGK